MYIESNSHTDLLPPAERNDVVMMRKKKIRLPVRAAALILMIAGIFSILAVGVGKINDGSLKKAVFDKLSGFLAVSDTTFAEGGESSREEGTEKTDSGSMPTVLLPSPEQAEQTEDTKGAEDTPKDSTTADSTGDSGKEDESGNDHPEGALLIVTAGSPDTSSVSENMTHRNFDINYLEAMKTAVLHSDGGPVCLVIHTHATESYLPAGTKYYHPESGELARSTNDTENVTSVGKAFADALNAAGIPTLHLPLHHDEDGAGRAYINSKSTVAYYLSKYPTIKYVFDIHRSAETDSDGNIVRDSFTPGSVPLARIRLTVSGGSSLSDAGVNANLSLALKLRSLLCDYSSSLVHPVLISDAVYCDGYAPRTLKIDIGSCASTLTEAKESAKILAEALVSLLCA